MSRWSWRAGLLMVVAGLLFAWVPDVDLGDAWGGGRAASAPETGLPAGSGAEKGCQRDVDSTPDPTTDITAFTAEGSSKGLLLTARFHDLRPRVQQDVELDLRTSRGHEYNVSVARTQGGSVEVMIGDAPDPVGAAARAADCAMLVTLQEVGGCDGLTARMDARRDLVTVRVPRHCLGNARWVRAGVSSLRYVSARVIPQDVWLPPGAHRRSSFGPLGPWVSLVP